MVGAAVWGTIHVSGTGCRGLYPRVRVRGAGGGGYTWGQFGHAVGLMQPITREVYTVTICYGADAADNQGGSTR